MNPKPKVVVLGCNFAGLTVSRYLRQEAKDAIDITVIDRKNYVNFIPNIHKGFYMHTNEWWGGDTSILKMGFKNMYYTLGGKVPSWGMPFSELIGDHTFV